MDSPYANILCRGERGNPFQEAPELRHELWLVMDGLLLYAT